MILVIMAFMILLCNGSSAQENDGYLRKGDGYFEKWSFRKALLEYINIYKKDSTDYEALWRISS